MAALERAREVRAAAKAGKIVDPSERRRGQVKNDQKPAGRPKAKARGYESTHKPLGAPILRRDPTAPEKLMLLHKWEARAREENVHVRDLPSRLKRELEATWHWKWETISKWLELKTAFAEIVSRLRLGQRGLRPFGSRRPLREIRHGQGARVRVFELGVATKQRPLETVMHKLHHWFVGEREHRHEVRDKTILTRLKFELEYERDKQLVLEQHSDEHFNPWALKAIQDRLATFKITEQTRVQEDWFNIIVRPRIGATPRTGQCLSESVDRPLRDQKHLTTWATTDRFAHLIARGNAEDLRIHVADPQEFAKNRESTTTVVLDATALWLKLRGEEKVYISEKEKTSREAR